MAESTGTVSFGKETKSKRRLIITDEDGNNHEELIHNYRTLNVFEGEQVSKGRDNCRWRASSHDILRLQGVEPPR